MRFALRVVVAAILVVSGAPSAVAQEGFRLHSPALQLSARGGANQQLLRGELFSDFQSLLTLDRADFQSLSLSGEVVFLATPRFDIGVGASWTVADVRSEYRDWLGSDGRPIEQDTRLEVTPVTLLVRYHLADRGRRIGSFAWVPATYSPYIGAGLGIVSYTLRQRGEFVDIEDLSIFESVLESSGMTVGGNIAAGIDRWITPGAGVNLEVRYNWGSAESSSSFRQYPSIDLSGVQVGLGVSLRI